MSWLTTLRTNYNRFHHMMDPIRSIVEWNQSRNLVTYDSTTEDRLLAEEMQELSEARAADDIHGIIDAYADMIVVITGSIHKLGYYPNEVLAETLLEISSRKGAIDPITGKWQKDANQDPTTLYKADYSDCK
jgi:predicted HAD superfamily Cof-like phosphohydrolase